MFNNYHLRGFRSFISNFRLYLLFKHLGCYPVKQHGELLVKTLKQ